MRILLRSVVLLLLAAGIAPGAQAQVNRETPPVPGPPPALQLPPIQRFTLSNGLPVVLMEKHQVPLLQLTMLVRAGAVDDPAGKHGLAAMTLDMMDEGAGSLDALALADAVDFLGASLSTRASLHTSTVELFTPLSKLPEALPLFADVVLRPAFAETELRRLRLQRLTERVQAHDDPNTIAATLFNRALYGTEHPYGAPAGDVVETSLRSFTPEDLRRFHETYFHPNNATLIVVGDVTPDAIRPQLEAAFGAWQPGDVRSKPVAPPRQVPARTIYLVDKPGAAQSVIRIGRIGAARDTEDYYKLVVLNTVLGGSFNSRLNQNLREDKGYSYGAGSTFSFRPVPGPFLASAAVQTDVTAPALTEFMKELRGILETIPDDELTRAKNYVALQFPRTFQTVEDIADHLAELVAYGLPDDYFNRYQERILAVTPAEVREAARRYLDPERVAIVVVGDRAIIEEPVRALGLGPVEVLSTVDVLGEVPELSE